MLTLFLGKLNVFKRKSINLDKIKEDIKKRKEKRINT